MPTASRRLWMREYMKEYRQGKLRRGDIERPAYLVRREPLREAHRFHTLKWRFSKWLGSRYEILLCAQYAPMNGVFKKII